MLDVAELNRLVCERGKIPALRVIRSTIKPDPGLQVARQMLEEILTDETRLVFAAKVARRRELERRAFSGGASANYVWNASDEELEARHG